MSAPESGSQSVKWNGIALVGRQAVTMGATVLLARLLGPESYGVIAQASIYIALTTLLLDQGLSLALVSRSTTTPRQMGAAAGLNLLLAATLLVLTILLARPVADLLGGPDLPAVLIALGAGLFFKAYAIVPRVVLMREMRFRSMAVAEPLAATVGAIAAVVSAFAGLDYWSLVVQILVGDALLAVLLAATARSPWPNLHFRTLRDTLGFSLRALGEQLISFFARNTDSILVSRLFGPAQLSYYAVSYRVLLAPIQMIGQVVTRVLFPAVAQARRRGDRAAIVSLVVRSERAIAVVAFPTMLLIAVASSDIIALLLGAAWAPAAPVLSVLALTGARQAVTSINSPVLLAMGRPDTQLRFGITAAVVQVGGMVAGLPWGIFGVALGYTLAGLVLTPLIGLMQRAVVGIGLRAQIRPLVAPLHAALWATVPYLVAYWTPAAPLLRAIVCTIVGILVYAAVFRLAHGAQWRSVWRDARGVIGR